MSFVERRTMNHPGTANYYNWTVDFRDMNYSEAGSEDFDDFDPSRCGHVDEHYSQARKNLEEQIVSDIRPCLKYGKKFRPEVLEFWRTFKGSKAQRTTLFFKGFQISLIKIGSPDYFSAQKN